MKTSESIEHIAKALNKMQTEIKDAPKDSQAYGYKYADLGAILQLVRPVMASCDLSVIQMPCSDGDSVGITTRLMHNSGEWIEDTLLMGVTQAKNLSMAQSAGSTLTYCRRYALASVCGVAQVDDDNQVSNAEHPVLATEKQVATIRDFIAADKMSPRRATWIGNNMDRMTKAQAQTIIDESKE